MTRIDPRLELLRPDPAAREAAARLGLCSVSQLLDLDPVERDPELHDLAARAGELRTRLAELEAGAPVTPQFLATPIDDVLEDERTRRLLHRTGIGSVAEFLATPPERLLEVRGIGARTVESCSRAVRRALERRAPTLLEDLLPVLRLDALPLTDATLAALREFDLEHLTDLQALRPDSLSEEIRAEIRQALASRVPRADSQGPNTRPTRLGHTLRRQVLDHLEQLESAEAARAVRGLLGVDCRPRRVRTLAAQLKIEPDEVLALAADGIESLRDALSPALQRLRRDAERELTAAGGVLDPRRVARQSELGRTLSACAPGDFVLRLLAALDPDRLSFDGQRLIAMPRPLLRSANRALGRILHNESHRPLATRVQRRLAKAVEGELPEDLLPHLLEKHHGRSLRFRVHGPPRIVDHPPQPADRLERILSEEGGPLHLDDLQFHYRDRHRHGSRRRIHQTLRGHRRFVETGPCSFELRTTLLDELETARPFAERFRDQVLRTGCRTSIFDADASDAPAPSVRTAHLALDQLREDRAVRYLGRGEFVPRIGRRGSALVAELVEDLRRAMGELPFARFLQNQPPRRRGLVARLLRENRRFVFPTKDRVDLLDNYPFGQERLRQLIRETEIQLEEHNGHASIEVLSEAVDRAGLGGSFLTHHLLLDLLRRHGDFEILPGPVVARADLGLGAWIQRTARDVLRSARGPLSAAQVLAHSPELAEFAPSLEPMLDLDPMVHTADGLHYQIT